MLIYIMYIYCVTYVSEVIVEEKNDQIHPFPRRKGERTYFRQRGTHACKERMKKKKKKKYDSSANDLCIFARHIAKNM